jgi:hypothetical protein
MKKAVLHLSQLFSLDLTQPILGRREYLTRAWPILETTGRHSTTSGKPRYLCQHQRCQGGYCPTEEFSDFRPHESESGRMTYRHHCWCRNEDTSQIFPCSRPRTIVIFMVHSSIAANAKDINSSRSPGNRGRDAGEDATETDPARPRSTVPVLPVHRAISANAKDGEVIGTPFRGNNFRLKDATAVFPTPPRGAVPPAVIAVVVRADSKDIATIKVK